MFLIKRIVFSILAVFLACIAGIFFWRPEALRRNTIYHCRILLAFTAGVALDAFAVNLGIRRAVASAVLLSLCLLCFIAWTVLFTRAGERIDPPEPMSPDAERWRQHKRDLGDLGRRLTR